MTPEEMFRKLEYLPGVQREEYELEGAVDTDLTLPAGHVIMTRFGHVEWGGIRRRTYVWEYGEEDLEYYLRTPRSDTPHSHRFVARSSLRLISPEDAETTAEQPAVRATELTESLRWHPMSETPPRSGNYILGIPGHSGTPVALLGYSYGCWWKDGNQIIPSSHFTHWCPLLLPVPPAKEE